MPGNVLGAIAALLVTAALVSGQGLELIEPQLAGLSSTTAAAASSTYKRFREVSDNAAQWRSAVNGRMHAAVNGRPKADCATEGILCGASGSANYDVSAMLKMATSPSSYSAADSITSTTGSRYRQVLQPMVSQDPCHTCVAHAVAAAAEAAVASVMQVDASTVSISEQDLYYCSRLLPLRVCKTGWSLTAALDTLTSQPVRVDRCLQALPVSSIESLSAVCKGFCNDTDPLVTQGRFQYARYGELWELQAHIRAYGGVVSRFDVYTDLVPFYSNPSNGNKVYQPGPAAKFDYYHAVLLVGYNNTHDPPYWVARNSWGPAWAENGFFKVAMDTCGVADTSTTYGVQWIPQRPVGVPQAKALPVQGRPGCFMVQAPDGWHLSRFANMFSVSELQLLHDNAAAISDPGEPVKKGTRLVVCSAAIPNMPMSLPRAAPVITELRITRKAPGQDTENIHHLHIAELQAFGRDGKPRKINPNELMVSSEHPGDPKSYMLDGRPDTWHHSKFDTGGDEAATMKRVKSDHWIVVKLPASQQVARIVILNRFDPSRCIGTDKDNCWVADRLAGAEVQAHVEAGDGQQTLVMTSYLLGRPGRYAYIVSLTSADNAAGPKLAITAIDPPAAPVITELRITRKAPGQDTENIHHLHIAELQAFGRDGKPRKINPGWLSASSSMPGNGTLNMLDGKRDTFYHSLYEWDGQPELHNTRINSDHWVVVQLPAEQQVARVVIVNRFETGSTCGGTDGRCRLADRLAGAQVQAQVVVGDGPAGVTTFVFTGYLPGIPGHAAYVVSVDSTKAGAKLVITTED